MTDDASSLPGLWYAAGPSRAFKRGRVVHRVSFGRPMALGRDADGAVFALEDLCPHRGALLSAGGFDGRELECPFHGWRFATDGACTAVPSMGARPFDMTKIRTKSFETVERQGVVWVKSPGEAPAVPPPDLPGVGESARPKVVTELVFKTEMDNAVFGLLDPAHGPYVHASALWRSKKTLKDKEKAFAPIDLGFAMTRHPPSSNSFLYRLLGGERTTEISFRLPGLRIEHIEVGRHAILNVTAMTPMDAGRTRALNLIYWTNRALDVFAPVMHVLARRFLGQDEAIMAVQNRGLAYDPPMMLVMDADAQQRWYLSLKKAWCDAAACGGAFENPVRPATLRWRT